MQVLADDPSSAFGAATLEMNYDPVLLQPESCFQDSEGTLSLALCNLDFAPGVARFNALTTEGVISDTVLAEVTFRVLDPTQGLEV